MKLTFWGAAGQVTGSMFLLELENDYNLLIDCGLDLSKEQLDAEDDKPRDAMYDNMFPFEANFINAVLLTHAHIDHSGSLPNLVREGFEGKIICTRPTIDLTRILLMDSAVLHRKKINKINGSKKGKNRVGSFKIDAGWYLEHHVEDTYQYFEPIPYSQRVRLTKGVHVTYIPAGHLLGAASILLEVEENGKLTRLGFSGDLGRFDYPLLNDPEPFPEVDYLISESTYGNRHHTETRNPDDVLADIIIKTCVDMPGRLIIPAFSVGRTQGILYMLNKIYAERDIAPVKVFADSPMAILSSEVYQKYSSWLNAESKAFGQTHGELFDFKNLHYVESMRESKAVANYNEPCIIVSSSGMISGGRVEYHVRMNISNPYACIFMVGYSAEGTLGHRLMNGQKTLKINDKEFNVAANIERTDAFSGHGDVDDLLAFSNQQNKEHLKGLFLVHGDEQSLIDYQFRLQQEGFHNVVIPNKGQTFIL